MRLPRLDRFALTVVAALLMMSASVGAQGLAGIRKTPSADMFYKAVAARTTIIYEGIAVVRTRREKGESVTRFRLYHSSDDKLRREYLGPEDRVRDIFIMSGKDLVRWRPHARGVQVHKFPLGKQVDRFGEIDLILRNYNVVTEGEELVAGRQTFRLRFNCRHGNRPPVRVWVDTQNLMILQEVRYDLLGRPTIERRFEEIRFPKELNSELFASPDGLKIIDMTARAVKRQAAPMPVLNPEELLDEAREKLKGRIWLPTRIPDGFELTSVRSYVYTRADPHRYTLHLGYSDGLTALSIFIQEGAAPQPSFGMFSMSSGKSAKITLRTGKIATEITRPDGPEKGTISTVKTEPKSERRTTAGQTPVKRVEPKKPHDKSDTEAYHGVELSDHSRGSKTVLRREDKGVRMTVIGQIDRVDLLDILVGVEPEDDPVPVDAPTEDEPAPADTPEE